MLRGRVYKSHVQCAAQHRQHSGHCSLYVYMHIRLQRQSNLYVFDTDIYYRYLRIHRYYMSVYFTVNLVVNRRRSKTARDNGRASATEYNRYIYIYIYTYAVVFVVDYNILSVNHNACVCACFITILHHRSVHLYICVNV